MKFFILAHAEARRRAHGAIDEAGDGYSVTIKPPGRTLDQSSKFHAICTDLAKSHLQWMGKKRTAAEWKTLIMSGHAVATKEGAEIIPGLENEFVNIRESSANMSRQRISSLIEYTLAFCSANGIKLKDEN